MTEVSRHLRNIFFHKIPPILKLEVGFLSDKKSFEIFCRNTVNKLSISYWWPKFQVICGTFFFTKYPRFWTWSWIFVRYKKDFADFRKYSKFFCSKLTMCKISAKSENLLGSLTHSVITTRFAHGSQGRGVAARCTRLRHRTCKTSRSSRKAKVHTASAQNVQD